MHGIFKIRVFDLNYIAKFVIFQHLVGEKR